MHLLSPGQKCHTFIGLTRDCKIYLYDRLVRNNIPQHGCHWPTFRLLMSIFHIISYRNCSISSSKHLEQLLFRITFKINWLPFELTSHCFVLSRMKSRFAKISADEKRVQQKLSKSICMVRMIILKSLMQDHFNMHMDLRNSSLFVNKCPT